jgi:hypothetical protein
MPIQLVGQPQPLPSKYHCPECKTECPPYGFHMMGGDLGMVGTVQYFTIFCAAAVSGSPEKDVRAVVEAALLWERGEGTNALDVAIRDYLSERPVEPVGSIPPKLCGHIFAVQVLQYMPPRDPAMLAQLQALMKGQSPA